MHTYDEDAFITFWKETLSCLQLVEQFPSRHPQYTCILKKYIFLHKEKFYSYPLYSLSCSLSDLIW